MKKIEIKGPIIPNDYQEVYDAYKIQATSPKKVVEQLIDDEDIEILINSTGGDVWSGSEIYTALKEHTGHVTIKIVGIAASAASFIACAGDTVKMSPTGQFMIHNAAFVSFGDHQEMTKSAEVLQVTDESIRNAYKLKAQLADEDLIDMMNKETWLNAKQAKEYGFVDEVMFDDSLSLVASTGNMLSPEAIAEMKAKLSEEPTKVEIDVDEIANKVIEKMNEQEEKPRAEQNSSLAKFLF